MNILKKNYRHTYFISEITDKDFATPLFKKHRFRTPFDCQHVKGSQPLLKSAWEHFRLVFSSLWDNLISNIPSLLTFSIFGLLGIILTANEKYALRDCQNLFTPVQMHLFSKLKPFFTFFCSICRKYLKFWKFSQKIWPSYLLYFGNYRLSKAWLDHSVKNTVSEHSLTVNMLKCPKFL